MIHQAMQLRLALVAPVFVLMALSAVIVTARGADNSKALTTPARQGTSIEERLQSGPIVLSAGRKSKKSNFTLLSGVLPIFPHEAEKSQPPYFTVILKQDQMTPATVADLKKRIAYVDELVICGEIDDPHAVERLRGIGNVRYVRFYKTKDKKTAAAAVARAYPYAEFGADFSIRN